VTILRATFLDSMPLLLIKEFQQKDSERQF